MSLSVSDRQSAAARVAAARAAAEAALAQLLEAQTQHRETMAGGTVVVALPLQFSQPLNGEVDPIFGMSAGEWRTERAAGFQGWRQSGQGRGARVWIDTLAAREWLARHFETARAARGGEAADGAEGRRSAEISRVGEPSAIRGSSETFSAAG